MCIRKKFDLVHQTAYPHERVGSGDGTRVWQSMAEYDSMVESIQTTYYRKRQSIVENGQPSMGVM